MIWLLLLPILAAAEYLEKASIVKKQFNLTRPYESPRVLVVKANKPVEILLSSCEHNNGYSLGSAATSEITLLPRDLLKILTDTSKGCKMDPFYGEPTANASVFVYLKTKDQPALYEVYWPTIHNGIKFDVNSSNYYTLTSNVDLHKGLYIHASLTLNSSIELSVAGCVQQQGLPLFNLSSPSSRSLNLSSSTLIDIVEKILCPGDSLLYHGQNVNLYFIIKTLTPLSSGLLHIAPAVQEGFHAHDGPRLKRNIDSTFTLEEKATQYSHIDPIEKEEQEIKLDILVVSGRLRVSIMGCDETPPVSMGEFIPGLHTVIINSLLESGHCNYTVKTGIPLTLEAILRSEGHIKFRLDDDSSFTIFTIEYLIILILIILIIAGCAFNIYWRLQVHRKYKARIYNEKSPNISIIETSWH